jgi:hypothetical protein
LTSGQRTPPVVPDGSGSGRKRREDILQQVLESEIREIIASAREGRDNNYLSREFSLHDKMLGNPAKADIVYKKGNKWWVVEVKWFKSYHHALGQALRYSKLFEREYQHLMVGSGVNMRLALFLKDEDGELTAEQFQEAVQMEKDYSTDADAAVQMEKDYSTDADAAADKKDARTLKIEFYRVQAVWSDGEEGNDLQKASVLRYKMEEDGILTAKRIPYQYRKSDDKEVPYY